jgi:putative oxidoreductase
MTATAMATLAVRYLLVMLFFPFSAADKIFNFAGAVAQAREIASPKIAVLLILAGVATEILMPLGILTGIADRAAGFVMACYCMVTALLWKQFWKPGDFWRAGASKGRDLFWDFLKNFSLAGGFLLLVVAHGTLGTFLANPLASSHPYAQEETP